MWRCAGVARVCTRTISQSGCAGLQLPRKHLSPVSPASGKSSAWAWWKGPSADTCSNPSWQRWESGVATGTWAHLYCTDAGCPGCLKKHFTGTKLRSWQNWIFIRNVLLHFLTLCTASVFLLGRLIFFLWPTVLCGLEGLRKLLRSGRQQADGLGVSSEISWRPLYSLPWIDSPVSWWKAQQHGRSWFNHTVMGSTHSKAGERAKGWMLYWYPTHHCSYLALQTWVSDTCVRWWIERWKLGYQHYKIKTNGVK